MCYGNVIVHTSGKVTCSALYQISQPSVTRTWVRNQPNLGQVFAKFHRIKVALLVQAPWEM